MEGGSQHIEFDQDAGYRCPTAREVLVLMTKSELIDSVAGKLNLPNGKAELIVNTVFDSMEDSLSRGERIEIRGFGSFEVRNYKSYEGRNPRTGAPVKWRPSGCLSSKLERSCGNV